MECIYEVGGSNNPAALCTPYAGNIIYILSKMIMAEFSKSTAAQRSALNSRERIIFTIILTS